MNLLKRNKITIDKEVFQQYYDRIYKTSYFITRDPYVAQDVVQETFVKAIKNVHTLKDANKIGSWLNTIAARTAIDFLKKESRWVVEELHDGFINYENTSPISSVEKEVSNRFTKKMVENEIDNLEPIFRMVMILKYVAELTDEEIATTLDISLGTVKSRLFRAKSKLKKSLENEIDIKEGLL